MRPLSPLDLLVAAILVGLNLYLVADLCAFTVAAYRCIRAKRYDDWFQEAKRWAPGSGFRLLKRFSP